MSNLPQALQRQIDEAEELERQLTQPQAEEAHKADEAPVAEPVAEPTAEAQPEAHKPEDQFQQTQSREEDAGYWKQRFATVQGMLNAQSQQFRETQTQLQALSTELAQIKAEKSAPVEKKPDPVVTDKDVETFGSDLINLQERVAKKVLAEAEAQFRGVIDQQADYIKQLESRLGVVDQKVTASAQDMFYDALGKQVPEWEQINADQKFLNWLGEIDPLTGVSRQAYLDDAHGRLDLNRVAAIFNAFKGAAGYGQQPVKNQARAEELQRQVAPAKSKTAAATIPASEKIWTKAEYERAYDPRYTRHLSADEAAKLEAEADRAVAEGRVQF